jgi:hypothetical protein
VAHDKTAIVIQNSGFRADKNAIGSPDMPRQPGLAHRWSVYFSH